MNYDDANEIALRTLEELRPHCIRCEIAGSLRRLKPEVKDIEICAIPKPYQPSGIILCVYLRYAPAAQIIVT